MPSRAARRAEDTDDLNGRFLTAEDAARYLTLAPQTISNLTSKGLIPVIHIGRRCVYDREALLGWVLEQADPVTPCDSRSRQEYE